MMKTLLGFCDLAQICKVKVELNMSNLNICGGCHHSVFVLYKLVQDSDVNFQSI